MTEEDTLSLELEELISSAQKQPGIAELMSIYGQTAELMHKSNKYLGEFKPKSIVWSSSSST